MNDTRDKSNPSRPKGLNRRQFALGSAAAAAALPFAASPFRAFGASNRPVNFASFGGYYNETIDKTIIQPFQKETGINVRMASNTSLASLKGQINANAIQWDIAELTGSEFQIAKQQKIPLEPLDFDIIRTENIPDYAIDDYGIKYAFFLEVMAWNRKQIATPPKTWAEFFDPKAYQATRSLYTTLSDSMLLEFALIADGVALDQLYPLDVDRALAVLSQLPPEQILWYETNQQVIQQMQSGQSDLGMPFTGRIRVANQGGADIGHTANQGGATGDYLVIPKGAPNAKQAMKLIDFICNDGPSAAAFMRATYYGLSNKKAISLLDDELAQQVPTSPALQDTIFRKDDAWWAENLDRVTQQFRGWQVLHA
ncbi:extracellular solute-binding protein [Salinisphaera sp. S4-8]|uniref:extracellular solute-binding protein n=1 Tax=Salinisphaera sp. S4-8 TaxID=633357 RepID=UPI003342B3D6